MANYKNILLVRTDRIGDVVLTTPAIEALRKKYPDAKISMLVTPVTKDIIVHNEYIDEIIVDDRKKRHRGVVGFLKLVREVSKKKIDLAIIYHTKKRTNLLCFLAGIPHRLGYFNNKYGFLLSQKIHDNRHEGQKHEIEYCLDLILNIGVTKGNEELSVSLNDESEQWINQYYKKRNFAEASKVIVIHPGASDPSKMWAIEKFAELSDELTKRYSAKVIIIGDKNIKSVSQKIERLTHESVYNLTGKISLNQCVSLLKRSDLLISNDSGPVHLAAAAVKTPVISIFTRNQPGINPERWAPVGKCSRVVSVQPDMTETYTKARPLSPEISDKITVSSVLEEVDSIFKLC